MVHLKIGVVYPWRWDSFNEECHVQANQPLVFGEIPFVNKYTPWNEQHSTRQEGSRPPKGKDHFPTLENKRRYGRRFVSPYQNGDFFIGNRWCWGPGGLVFFGIASCKRKWDSYRAPKPPGLPNHQFKDANPSPPIKKTFSFFVKLKKGAIKSWNCFSIFKLGRASFPDGETSRNTPPIIPSSGEKDLLGGLHTQGQRMAKHSITRPLIPTMEKNPGN